MGLGFCRGLDQRKNGFCFCGTSLEPVKIASRGVFLMLEAVMNFRVYEQWF